MAGAEIFQFWSIKIDDGSSMQFPIIPTSKFFPGQVALSSVEGLDDLPKPLGQDAMQKQNFNEPTSGSVLETPLEFAKIVIHGTSYQEANNYDAMMANNGPNVQRQPYGMNGNYVTINQWTSVSAGKAMENTLSFQMSGPVIINVTQCRTMLPQDVQFQAEVLWGGNATLMRKTIDGNNKMPFTHIRCSDSNALTVLSLLNT